jgi:hypothetical protein
MMKFFLLLIVILPHEINLFVPEKSSSSNIIDRDSEVHGKWKLARNDSGIKIFTRWINVDNSFKVRQLKGEMVIDHPVVYVSNYIKDDEIASQWLNRTLEHKKIQSIGQNEWMTYTLFNLPWPFDNQDLVAKNTIHKSGENIVIQVDGMPDFIPEKQGINRIENFEGLWRLTRVGNDKTRVEYTIVTKVKPIAPRWITDPIINHNFWTTLDNLQNMLQ